MNRVQSFRKKYPKFIYEDYSYRISKNNLEIFFDFKITPGIHFSPRIIIENIDKSRIVKLNKGVFNNLVFYLGLIEIPSYWKATCSPEIEIRAGYLSQRQIKWWEDLIIQGMGQFFYENKIDFRKTSLLKIIPVQKENTTRTAPVVLNEGILVPVGGGKDSVVTLEILKKARKDINCLVLNPTKSAKKIMEIAGCKKPIVVGRKIDERLLELNRKGFLNGHTPFSAYLAFLSILLATIFDYKYIAFSNERSSNEGNVKYLGRIINHQWSKSFNFEKKFRKYAKRYLVKNIEYFSFLRPLYEIQIAKLFSKYPQYFSNFLSCNEAQKTYSGRHPQTGRPASRERLASRPATLKKPIGRWCCNCPKCLFVFTILYPFLKEKQLIKIFGENLFDKKTLLPIMQELTGEKKFKPFECVGTKKESLMAFYLAWEKANTERDLEAPCFLLKYFERNILPKYPKLKLESKKMMNSWDNQNNLPKELERILKKNLS